jgi:hypothetical protein
VQEGKMNRGRPSPMGRNKVSLRVLFSEKDYEVLERIAELERTDISTLVRRAVARHFFVPDNSNTVKQ